MFALHRHVGRRGAERHADPGAAIRPDPDLVTRGRRRERLVPGRLRRAHEQGERARASSGVVLPRRYPAGMRRLGLAVAVGVLAFTAQAQAATLTVSPTHFSPRHATLQLAATLTVRRQVGVRLVTPGGRAVGWIVAPSRRRTLAF